MKENNVYLSLYKVLYLFTLRQTVVKRQLKLITCKQTPGDDGERLRGGKFADERETEEVGERSNRDRRESVPRLEIEEFLVFRLCSGLT